MAIAQDHATSYEKAVFDAVNYLISPNRDDDVAFELHFKVGCLGNSSGFHIFLNLIVVAVFFIHLILANLVDHVCSVAEIHLIHFHY